MKIVINTPAGNVGRVVTDQLLQAKEEVVIISRHPEKVADLVARGASLVEGSIDDPLVLDRAERRRYAVLGEPCNASLGLR